MTKIQQNFYIIFYFYTKFYEIMGIDSVALKMGLELMGFIRDFLYLHWNNLVFFQWDLYNIIRVRIKGVTPYGYSKVISANYA